MNVFINAIMYQDFAKACKTCREHRAGFGEKVDRLDQGRTDVRN